MSRALHADPELSLEEVRAAARLTAFLRREGFRIQRGLCGLPTSFVARKAGGRHGPRLALLAEYDALPGIGHACGHNLIGAAAAGAGAALGRVIADLGGEVLVIGTPAEETIGGKAVMVDRGAFRGVDAVMMFHPSTEDRVYTTSLACHSLEVTYHGRAAHAVAAPEKGINALAALIHLFVSLEKLKRRLPREVRLPGVIVEGGRRANIVPERAVGRFTLRARDLNALRRVETTFRRAALASGREIGARVRIRSLDHPYAEMVTNHAMAEVFKRELRRLGRRTVDTPRERMGSLDMGNVSHRVPAIHPYVAIAPARAPLHSAAFAHLAGGGRGRAGLLVATRALALTGFQVLADPDLLGRVRREFRSFRRLRSARRKR
ncbi:MAG TPA: M20 family metallopeptidase [Candidatus Polarisedimenticolia bacterium]|nr:M20 family metallopeptidase [Candidatus Polarisedimenticolia bacterium]